MVIDITNSYSTHYLKLLSRFTKGLITSDKFTQYSMTLLLWQENAEINSDWSDDEDEL